MLESVSSVRRWSIAGLESSSTVMLACARPTSMSLGRDNFIDSNCVSVTHKCGYSQAGKCTCLEAKMYASAYSNEAKYNRMY